MKYLVINAGSSSKKIQVFEDEESIIKIQFKNHSAEDYRFELISTRISSRENVLISKRDYLYPIEYILDIFKEENYINSLNEFEFITHRIVHGGEEFTKPALLNEENIAKISKYNELAPIHNPPALEIVNHIGTEYPNINQYGVFDTTFHLTNPETNFLYGLPYGYYENIGVRKFGFHGSSYKYIFETLKEKFPKDDHINAIICHLGSGSSIASIKESVPHNHSFGFTPNENLIMSTRSGEVDYDAIQYLKKKMNLSDSDVETLLNNESGILGISGYTKDMRTIVNDLSTNKRADLAFHMYVDNVAGWIARLRTQMARLDYLVFTGGIGCGSTELRIHVCNRVVSMGIIIDPFKDETENVDEIKVISRDDSQTKIIIIPTNEELQMLRDVKEIL